MAAFLVTRPPVGFIGSYIMRGAATPHNMDYPPIRWP